MGEIEREGERERGKKNFFFKSKIEENVSNIGKQEGIKYLLFLFNMKNLDRTLNDL